MEFTLFELLRAFGFSVILGAALALIYEPVRVFHMLGFSKPIHYFICDFLFLVFCSVITYFFSLVYLEGSVRLFVIIGELTGFFTWYFTLGRVLGNIYAPVIKFLKKFASKLLKCSRKVMYNIKDKFTDVFKCKVMKYVKKKKKRGRKPSD